MLGPGDALAFVVALSLALTAVTLVAAGRRRPEDLLLATFLGLVAVNFAGLALHQPLPATLAFMALAADPVVLLLFVTRYPYRNPSRLGRVLLAQAAVVCVVSEAVLLVAPEQIVQTLPGGSPYAPARVLLLASFAVSYAGAWVLVVRAALRAPSPSLARRAAWLVAAVGVVVVPRMALVPADFGLADGHLGGKTLVALVEVALAAVVFAAGALLARGSPLLRRAFVFVGVAFVVMYSARLVMEVALWGTRMQWGFAGSFGLRWIVFSGILAHGILVHEVVELRRATDRILPALAGAVAGVAGGFLVATLLAPVVAEEPLAIAAGVAIGLAAIIPVGVLARWLAMGARRATASRDDRRLELYRAALESAWAAGPPSRAVRRSLERDRRAFGVSADEAGALEHVVRARLQPSRATHAPGDEPVPGLVLGAVLAEGAHGRVFEAQRFPAGERVVVKAMRIEHAPADARARLLTETKALMRVQHPHVARLLEVHAAPDQHLLVLSRAEGVPLDRALRDGPLDAARVRRLATTMLEGLRAAHAEGVVHRDLKPANVLVAPDGAACIVDFGVAQLLDARVGATAVGFAHAGSPAGTLAYMAPEQARGGAVDARADLYACALVLAEALLGRPARDLRGATWDEALARVASGAVELHDVPPPWRAWLERALAAEPDARWESAAAMLRAMPHA